jgi:hypothetical protein
MTADVLDELEMAVGSAGSQGMMGTKKACEMAHAEIISLRSKLEATLGERDAIKAQLAATEQIRADYAFRLSTEEIAHTQTRANFESVAEALRAERDSYASRLAGDLKCRWRRLGHQSVALDAESLLARNGRA